MTFSLTRLSLAFAVVLAALGVTGCGNSGDEAAYQAACHGPPLHSVEEREQAAEAGYTISRLYDCIDKASYLAVEEEKAKWAAANTPEAIAARAAERKQLIEQEQQARARAAEVARVDAPAQAVPAPLVLHKVDVNSATEAELAAVPGVGPVIAGQVVEQRKQHRIIGWPDLVHRVVGLSAAQPAVFASIGGLTVDGKSLDGAPADAAMAAQIRQREKKRAP